MDWSKILESVLVYVLPILAAALTTWVLAKVKVEWENFKRLKPNLANLLEQGAMFAVVAAEQMGIAKLIDDKKTYALQIAEDWLLLKGVKIDLHLIEAAIEKAVLELRKVGVENLYNRY